MIYDSLCFPDRGATRPPPELHTTVQKREVKKHRRCHTNIFNQSRPCSSFIARIDIASSDPRFILLNHNDMSLPTITFPCPVHVQSRHVKKLCLFMLSPLYPLWLFFPQHWNPNTPISLLFSSCGVIVLQKTILCCNSHRLGQSAYLCVLCPSYMTLFHCCP